MLVFFAVGELCLFSSHPCTPQLRVITFIDRSTQKARNIVHPTVTDCPLICLAQIMILMYLCTFPLCRGIRFLVSKHSKSRVLSFGKSASPSLITQITDHSGLTLTLQFSVLTKISIHSILTNLRNGGRRSFQRC